MSFRGPAQAEHLSASTTRRTPDGTRGLSQLRETYIVAGQLRLILSPQISLEQVRASVKLVDRGFAGVKSRVEFRNCSEAAQCRSDTQAE